MSDQLDDDNYSISSIDETEEIEFFTKEDEGHLIENALY